MARRSASTCPSWLRGERHWRGPPGARPAEAALRPGASTPAAHVLLVDDDENVTYVATGLLEQLGLRVSAAHSGVEALEIFSRKPASFDLAIVDEAMPRMTGSQLQAELRRLRPGLPVIIISGHGLPAGALFDDREVVRYLPKPFSAGDLADAVRQALRAARTVADGPAGSPAAGRSPGA